MPKAFNTLPKDQHYRTESYSEGLRRLGYTVIEDHPRLMEPDDVLVVWNRTPRSRRSVDIAREQAAAIIVSENGFYANNADGRQNYALALDGHNGSGRWYVGGPERLEALEIDFQPWKHTHTGRLLIADQRGIGSPQMASPPDFASKMDLTVRAGGYRGRVRPHPGRHAAVTGLLEDLADCQGLIVWSSNCATAALIAGYPTFYCAPHVILQGAAERFSMNAVKRPQRPDREQAFINMSWAQWTIQEIASGEPIQLLLDVHAGSVPACQQGLGV